MVRRKWSKQCVMEEIQQIYGKLSCSHPARKRLYEAATHHFGSWDTALKAAGVKRLQKTWSRAKVIQRIQQEYPERGLALWEDHGFLATVCRLFRSRSAALAAAGFSAVRLKWTPQSILDQLRSHAKRFPSFEGLAQQDNRLYQAARRHFGSWQQAIHAAGFATPVCWTKTAIVDAIQSRQRQNQPLAKVSQHDPELFRAAQLHFGGWRKALLAAGIAVRFPVTWTRERVHKGLRELKQRPDSFTMSQRATLRSASLKYFESWGAPWPVWGSARSPAKGGQPPKCYGKSSSGITSAKPIESNSPQPFAKRWFAISGP